MFFERVCQGKDSDFKYRKSDFLSKTLSNQLTYTRKTPQLLPQRFLLSKLNFHSIHRDKESMRLAPCTHLVVGHFSVMAEMIDHFHRLFISSAELFQLSGKLLRFFNAHMIPAHRACTHSRVQADQIEMLLFQQRPCLIAQVQAGIVSIKQRLSVFLEDIDQAFLSLVVIRRHGNDLPFTCAEAIAAVYHMELNDVVHRMRFEPVDGQRLKK